MGATVWPVLVTGVGYRLWRRRLDRLARMPDDFSAYWRRRARRPGQFRYVALGDSLSQGLTARRPERGFVGLLAARVAAVTGQSVAVLNLSVSGATVADVLADQLPRLAALPEPPDLVTVCIGSNDVTRTPRSEFAASFHSLCSSLPAGTLVSDVPDFRRGPHVAAAASLSAVCREVLASFPSLVPVALEAATRGMRVCELGLDLSHPGDAGHRRYCAAFWSSFAESTLPARCAG